MPSPPPRPNGIVRRATSRPRTFVQDVVWCFLEAHLKSILFPIAITLLVNAPTSAQTLVDPSKVAPEYREAAEKRRAEQLRQRECALKADLEKVLPRDRTAYLNHCLDVLAAKP